MRSAAGRNASEKQAPSSSPCASSAGTAVSTIRTEPQPQDRWSGRTGVVHEAMLADSRELAGIEVYVCGSVRMVETAVPALLAHGLDEGACFSDAFRPAALRTA